LKTSIFALSILLTVAAHAQSVAVLNDCHEIHLDHEDGNGTPSHSAAYSCFGDLRKATRRMPRLTLNPVGKDVLDQYREDAAYFGTLLTAGERRVLLLSAGYTAREITSEEQSYAALQRKMQELETKDAAEDAAKAAREAEQAAKDAASEKAAGEERSKKLKACIDAHATDATSCFKEQ